MSNARRQIVGSVRACRRAVHRAFTLVELLVAVGAVALIAVGLAAVFGSVGDTVTAGRSVSGFTAYASLMERQFRDDISHMTRDGFLLIVNQEAEGGERVALFPGQASGPAGQPPQRHQQRSRRVDEMVFFRKGDFTSGREPLGPGFTARSNSAMIYYGHGTRQPVDERVTSSYVRPRADDGYVTTGTLLPVTLGGPDAPGFPNPNRYASEWGLLRLPVVLVSDTGSTTDRLGAFGLPWDHPQLQDSDIQVAGQPAVRSVFRSMETVLLPAAPAAPPTMRRVLSPAESPSPTLASGLVDIATTDLEEVRRTVMSGVSFGTLQSPVFRNPSDGPATSDLEAMASTGYSGVVAPFFVQQAWMLDALPVRSVGFWGAGAGSGGTTPSWQALPGGLNERELRVRYETQPPAYLEYLGLTQPAAAARRAVRLADQMALTSPLLAPRCSEFIVEWSFGKVAPDGRLIWHGLRRDMDTDNDGVSAPMARPYLNQQYAAAPRDNPTMMLPYRLLRPAPSGSAMVDQGDVFGSFEVSPEVIHGFESLGSPVDDSTTFGDVLVSFFGFVSPGFNPSNPTPFPDDESASDYVPWAWPELIRITVSLADPSDPSIEQTFQFVFDAPGNPAP